MKIYMVMEDDGEIRYSVAAFLHKRNAMDCAKKLDDAKDCSWHSYSVDEFTLRDA